jgi:hypothetical protein
MPPKTNSPSSPTLNISRPKSRFKRFAKAILAFLVIALIYWSVSNINALRDWYILATYQPPKIVAQLATEDTMTNYARNLFYLNKPAIENRLVFAANCPSGGNQTHVIGCYHEGDNGIFLLNVSDTRLNGIVPVTAAYEMLHAGYARLSSSERTTIDRQMWLFYISNSLSSEIKSQMASYAVTEPGAKYDELYSVLGTEVANLPPQLVSQYRIYFTDRNKIVSTYNNYQSAFNSRENQIAAYSAEISALKGQISSNNNRLGALQTMISQQQNLLEADKSSGDFTSYNQGVPGYNALIDQYNSLVESTQSDINRYNTIVNESNALALEENQLIQAISSGPTKQTVTSK